MSFAQTLQLYRLVAKFYKEHFVTDVTRLVKARQTRSSCASVRTQEGSDAINADLSSKAALTFTSLDDD